jgi:hypothetical protein
MRLYRLGCCICLLAFAAAACNGIGLHVSTPENVNAPGSPTPTNQKQDETLYSLDLEKPEIEQQIKAGEVAGAKFVQVEVAEVTNPKLYPVQLEVRYQPKDGEKIFLGSFSLYPPNNPGKFIVATQGKVKDEGTIILTLAKSERMAAGDVVKVRVKRIRFVNESR